MPLTDYFFPEIALDFTTGLPVPDAEADIFALTDTGYTTPLAITDLNGVALPKLKASPTGIYPAFRCTGYTQVVAKSGDLVTPITSRYGFVHEVVGDPAGVPDGYVLTTSGGALVYQPAPSGGGGGTVIVESSSDMPTPGNNLTKMGIVLTHGPSAFDQKLVESPAIAYDPECGLYAMAYVGYTTGNVGSIGLAWSSDLLNWTKDGQLLVASGATGAPDEYGCTGPLLVLDDGLWYLFYIGLTAAGYEGGTKRLCVATSPSLTDPVWTRHGAIISPSGTGWRQEAIWHPSIVKDGDAWYCFFNATGNVGVDETIGYATATDLLGPWTVDDANSPLIDAPGSIVISGDPCVQKMPGGWRMDFFRYDNVHGWDLYAVTTDADFPLGWTIANGGEATVEPSETYDAAYAHKPFIVRMGGRVYHFYTAVAADMDRQIAVAVEPPLADAVVSLPAVVSDDFNRANGSLGSTSVGSKPWVTSGGAGWAINANRAVWSGTTDGAMLVDTGIADSYRIEFTAVDVTGQWPFGIIVRGSSSTTYTKIVRDQTADRWTISSQSGGSPVYVTHSTDVVDGDIVRVEVVGTTFRVYLNGTLVATFTGYTSAAGSFQGVVGSGNLALIVDTLAVTEL